MKKSAVNIMLLYMLLFLGVFLGPRSTEVRAEPRAKFSSSPEALLISYNLVSHMLDQEDTTPLIRIYGDGTVLIHYPKYSPRAGDYSTLLSKGEFQKVLNMVTDKGLAGFKAQDVAAKRKQAKKKKEQESGLIHAVSEVDETRIELFFDEFQENTGAAVEKNVRKKISWNNLYSDVKQYLEVHELRKLAEAEETLRQLLGREDLEKLEE